MLRTPGTNSAPNVTTAPATPASTRVFWAPTSALTGPVSGAIGAQSTLIGAGLIGGVITFGALLLPGMRAIEGREAPASA